MNIKFNARTAFTRIFLKCSCTCIICYRKQHSAHNTSSWWSWLAQQFQAQWKHYLHTCTIVSLKYHIAGNFWGWKLSRICETEFRGENFRGFTTDRILCKVGHTHFRGENFHEFHQISEIRESFLPRKFPAKNTVSPFPNWLLDFNTLTTQKGWYLSICCTDSGKWWWSRCRCYFSAGVL